MLYVGTYPQIYPPTILRLGIVSRDGLPRGTLPSGILKLEKYCPGLKVRHPSTVTNFVQIEATWILIGFNIKPTIKKFIEVPFPQ